jgi:hypothetical protein
VYIVTNDKAALLGAAQCAASSLAGVMTSAAITVSG